MEAENLQINTLHHKLAFEEEFEHSKCHIASIAITPNNQFLFIGINDGTLKQYNLKRHNKLQKDYGRVHRDLIKTMTILPDGKILFTGSFDHHLKQWNIKYQQLIRDWTMVHTGQLRCMKLCLDSTVLVTSGGDMTIKKQDIRSGKILCNSVTKIHQYTVTRIAITPDEEYVFTGSTDMHMKQWKLENFELVKDWGAIHRHYVSGLAITPDGQYVFSGSFDRHIKQWSIHEQNLYKDYGAVHDHYICCLLISKNSKYLWSTGFDGYVKKWDIPNQKLVQSFDINLVQTDRGINDHFYNDIWCLDQTSDEQDLYTGGGTKQGSLRQFKVLELTDEENELYEEKQKNSKQEVAGDQVVVEGGDAMEEEVLGGGGEMEDMQEEDGWEDMDEEDEDEDENGGRYMNMMRVQQELGVWLNNNPDIADHRNFNQIVVERIAIIQAWLRENDNADGNIPDNNIDNVGGN